MDNNHLPAKERLVVSADFNLEECGNAKEVYAKVIELAKELRGLGVYIKVNSILRFVGYRLINELHNLGLKVFADLKLNDIGNTIKADALLLKEVGPEIVTIMCSAGTQGMKTFRENIGNKTEVLGVTVFTNFDDDTSLSIFGCNTKPGVLKFAAMAKSANLNGLVLSPQEADMIRRSSGLEQLSLNTPGIRPQWAIVKNDDQKRILTPSLAIGAGVTRVIVGRPIINALDKREATQKILEEIESSLKVKST